tara:strand:+ start:6010 stop:7371 length:1362 start_codon:yes stop_codon:yes gene_type:complete
MSDHGSTSTHASDDPGRLVRRIRESLDGAEEVSLNRHLKACGYLCRLRRTVSSGGPLAAASRGPLLCTGIAVWRLGRVDVSVDDDHARLLQRTCTLIFAVLCMSELSGRVDRLADTLATLSTAESAHVDSLLEQAGRATLWELIRPRRRVRRKPQASYDTEADDAEHDGPDDAEVVVVEDDEEPDEPSGGGSRGKRSRGARWADAMRSGAGDLARGTLLQGVRQLQTDVFGPLDTLASDFFRYTAMQISETMLMPNGDRDFVTLESERSLRIAPAERAERLFNIVQNAESEAGQFVTRDLLLSLWLPASVVGLRRTLLLSRAASTMAGVEHPEVTQRAHEVAMQGAEWTWKNSRSEAERMSVLLAGVAVMTTKGKPGEADGIRKGDAFGGRVQMPCFETAQSTSGMRLALVPHSKRWILYRVSSGGMPTVLCSQAGFEGFCTCTLQLCAEQRR